MVGRFRHTGQGEVLTDKLTNKQTRFVEEYLRDFNATQAALRSGYSARTAYSIGSENLKKPEIMEAIRERCMSADEVLARMTDIARGDLADLMDITTTGYSLQLMVRNDNGDLIVNPKTKLIKKIKQKVTTFLAKSGDGEDRETIETEIELYNAQEALTTLGKYHKLFTDRTELTGKDGGAIPVEMFNGAVKKVYGGD